MGLRDAIALYRQKDGLISPDKNPTPDSTGNGIMYTSLYFILLVRLGMAEADDYYDFVSTIRACQKVYEKDGITKILFGLFNRSKTKQSDQEGPDDYFLLALAAKLLKAPFALDILRRAESDAWVFNNVEPDRFSASSYFGRMPWFRAHIYWCAGKRPSLALRASWCAYITWSAIFQVKDSSLAILSWSMIEAANDGSFMVALASIFFEKALNRYWNRGIKGAIERHLGPEHPLAIYWL